MKQCNKCKIEKSLKCFSRDKNSSDGLSYYCRGCIRIKSYMYNKSKRGIASKIYSTQKMSSKRRGHNPPSYSMGELREWLYSQYKFHEIYDKYKASGFLTKYVPSVDRIDDYVGYTMSNIQIVTWEENNNRGHSDRVNGINNKLNKTVIQFTKDNIFISEYHSVNETSRRTNTHCGRITECCNNIANHAGGFIWKYKGEES